MSTQTTTLADWLRGQLDDEEEACRRQLEGRVHDGPCINYVGQDPAWYDEYDSCALHLAAYRPYGNPYRGLAEVEAKRRILDMCSQEVPAEGVHPLYQDGRDPDEIQRDEAVDDALDAVARLLTLPYADRPGYRDEWRP